MTTMSIRPIIRPEVSRPRIADIPPPGPKKQDYRVPAIVRNVFKKIFEEAKIRITPQGITTNYPRFLPTVISIRYSHGCLTFALVLRLAETRTLGSGPAISIDELDQEVKSIVALRTLLTTRGYEKPFAQGNGCGYELRYTKVVPPEKVAEELEAFTQNLAEARPTME